MLPIFSIFHFESRMFRFNIILNSKHASECAQKVLNLVNKLDKKGLVIRLDKKDIKAKYSAGGTKGGQKANKSHSLVNLKHIPTGITAKGEETRLLLNNYNYALAKLRMAVDIEIKGDKSMFVIIRKQEEKKAQEAIEMKKLKNC